MTANNDLYCKIFVDTAHDREWLIKAIASTLKGAIRRRTIESRLMEVDVSKNEDADPSRRGGEGDFVFFPYYLDVVPVDEPEAAAYIATVASILQSLWRDGCLAVASCDFEDALPRATAPP